MRLRTGKNTLTYKHTVRKSHCSAEARKVRSGRGSSTLGSSKCYHRCTKKKK